MVTTRIAIIGGGLSGLYAAYLLERLGIKDYVVFEAQASLGGRIASVALEGESHLETVEQFDLGATWFWPVIQPRLAGLIAELKLESFAQYGEGDLLIEATDGKLRRMRVRVDAPSAMRLKGGMRALIRTLSEALEPSRLLCEHRVEELCCCENSVELFVGLGDGRKERYRAGHVLLAVPPRLAVNKIEFQPELLHDLAFEWRETATWMAPHAKYIAIYERPFWREQGLLGEARSGCGPLVEIHDASTLEGKGALFGFIGLPHSQREQFSDEELRSHCRNQLARMFGEEAATPRFDVIKDWANEAFTATAADLDSEMLHDIMPSATPSGGVWSERLVGIASEWSPLFPGYLAGAIEAASRGVELIVGEVERL